MHLSDHLSITAPLKDRKPVGERANRLEGEPIQALNQPLPFSMRTRNGLSLLLLLAAVAWFWQPLVSLFSLTQQQEHYSHIVLIPWLSLYVLYLDRKAIFASREWSPWLGSLVIGMGAWCYWSADAASFAPDQLSMTVLSFVVLCWGIVVSCFGITLCRKVSFGLLCLLLMVPLPSFLLDAIIGFLQSSSAEATDVLFSLLGVPVFRQGFVFSLSNFTIHVAEECSGIRSALSLIITSLVAGHFFLRSAWTKMGLVAVVVPLAIIKNAFRIVGLSLLANYVDPTFITDSALHRSGGIPLFLLSLVVLLFFAWLLRRCEKSLGASHLHDRILSNCGGSVSRTYASLTATWGMMSSPYTGVYAIDPLQDDRWPEFIVRHPNASVFHTRGWLGALQASYGYAPVAFTTSAPAEKLTNALLFCVVRSWLTGSRLVSLPFSDHCEPLVEDAAQFRKLYIHVESLRKKERWKYVEIRSANSLLDFDGNFSRDTTYHLHRLDLRPSLDALHKGFHKDCIQRKISRAERESLTYEAGRSPLLLQQLYGLLRLTRSRHHLPPQPFEWFQNLVACMEKEVCIRVASKFGQPIAGILTLDHGKKMVYKYGGSDTKFNNLGAMPMLLWQAIKEAQEAGAEELDLGRSDLDNPGLITFKERWSAVSSTLTTWRAPAVTLSPSFEHIKVRLAKEVLARLPDTVLTLAGRLLYRHIA